VMRLAPHHHLSAYRLSCEKFSESRAALRQPTPQTLR
jgi:hypothetical protein